MPEKLPAIKLTWDLVIWISGGISIVFGWFVRWYMMDVKGDIKEVKKCVEDLKKEAKDDNDEVKKCVNDLKTETREDINRAHTRIDGVVGKCAKCHPAD